MLPIDVIAPVIQYKVKLHTQERKRSIVLLELSQFLGSFHWSMGKIRLSDGSPRGVTIVSGRKSRIILALSYLSNSAL